MAVFASCRSAIRRHSVGATRRQGAGRGRLPRSGSAYRAGRAGYHHLVRDQVGPATFGTFDAFSDDSGRQAHVNGQIPKLLQEYADLFAQAPDFKMLDVLAVKLQ